MADDKAKTESSPQDPLIEILSLIFVVFLVASLFNSVVGVLRLDRFFSENFGLSSFTKKSLLLNGTRPLSSVLNATGAKIKVASENAYVYGDDLVTKYAKQKIGKIGSVIKGPVSFLGNKFFFIDFESGRDGFVKESDLAYVESGQSIFTKIILIFYKILDLFWYLISFVSIILLLWIIYLKINLDKIRQNEKEKLFPSVIEENAKVSQNPKWERVLVHVNSLNSSDWRLAIIEADILLSELLDKMNLYGDSIGDKLKSVEKSDFTTIDLAWEAHKIRNKIAHSGSDFVLTQKEARRIIDLYEKVFKEFSFI